MEGRQTSVVRNPLNRHVAETQNDLLRQLLLGNELPVHEEVVKQEELLQLGCLATDFGERTLQDKPPVVEGQVLHIRRERDRGETGGETGAGAGVGAGDLSSYEHVLCGNDP